MMLNDNKRYSNIVLTSTNFIYVCIYVYQCVKNGCTWNEGYGVFMLVVLPSDTFKNRPVNPAATRTFTTCVN